MLTTMMKAGAGAQTLGGKTPHAGGSNRQESSASSLRATHTVGSNHLKSSPSSLQATHTGGSNRQENISKQSHSLRATHTGVCQRRCKTRDRSWHSMLRRFRMFAVLLLVLANVADAMYKPGDRVQVSNSKKRSLHGQTGTVVPSHWSPGTSRAIRTRNVHVLLDEHKDQPAIPFNTSDLKLVSRKRTGSRGERQRAERRAAPGGSVRARPAGNVTDAMEKDFINGEAVEYNGKQGEVVSSIPGSPHVRVRLNNGNGGFTLRYLPRRNLKTVRTGLCVPLNLVKERPSVSQKTLQWHKNTKFSVGKVVETHGLNTYGQDNRMVGRIMDLTEYRRGGGVVHEGRVRVWLLGYAAGVKFTSKHRLPRYFPQGRWINVKNLTLLNVKPENLKLAQRKSQYKVGDIVKIRNVTNSTKLVIHSMHVPPHSTYNDHVGWIVYDHYNGTYNMRIKSTDKLNGQEIRIHADNLVKRPEVPRPSGLPDGVKVELHGLNAKDQNGRKGTILRWGSQQGVHLERFTVKFEDGQMPKMFAVKHGNLKLLGNGKGRRLASASARFRFRRSLYRRRRRRSQRYGN